MLVTEQKKTNADNELMPINLEIDQDAKLCDASKLQVTLLVRATRYSRCATDTCEGVGGDGRGGGEERGIRERGNKRNDGDARCEGVR